MTHGGKRAGAGRKAGPGGPRKQVSVYLTDEYLRHLDRIANARGSQGVSASKGVAVEFLIDCFLNS